MQESKKKRSGGKNKITCPGGFFSRSGIKIQQKNLDDTCYLNFIL